LAAADAGRITQLVAAAGLPTHVRGLSADALLAAMATDKKVAEGKLRFVLPTGIGQAEICTGVPEGLIREVLAGLGQTA